MGRVLKTGVAQFASTIGDVNANVETHLKWIGEARGAGLDLLVMPEVSLTGHFGVETLLDSAMHRSDPRLARLAEAAGDMAVVVGFIEEGPAAQFYNASVVLRGGRPIYLHRKVNLPSYGKLEEGKHYAAGRFVDNCRLGDDWTAGLLICADVWNPALAHLASLHGATLLVCPVSSGVEAVGVDFDNPAGWALTMRFYTMMYGAPAIMANRTGVERDLTFWGGSRIVDAFGHEVAVAGTGEEMIVAELDYAQVRKARHLLPTVRDQHRAGAARNLAAGRASRRARLRAHRRQLRGEDDFRLAFASGLPPPTPPPAFATGWGEGSDGAPFCSLPPRGGGPG